jgi:hypothetical protein
MLLELISKYHTWLIIFFIGVVLVKIVMSYLFHDNLEGTNGFLFAIFKWYTEENQEFEELASRRFMMRIHNIVTLLIYLLILLIIVVTVLPMFLK